MIRKWTILPLLLGAILLVPQLVAAEADISARIVDEERHLWNGSNLANSPGCDPRLFGHRLGIVPREARPSAIHWSFSQDSDAVVGPCGTNVVCIESDDPLVTSIHRYSVGMSKDGITDRANGAPSEFEHLTIAQSTQTPVIPYPDLADWTDLQSDVQWDASMIAPRINRMRDGSRMLSVRYVVDTTSTIWAPVLGQAR